MHTNTRSAGYATKAANASALFLANKHLKRLFPSLPVHPRLPFFSSAPLPPPPPPPSTGWRPGFKMQHLPFSLVSSSRPDSSSLRVKWKKPKHYTPTMQKSKSWLSGTSSKLTERCHLFCLLSVLWHIICYKAFIRTSLHFSCCWRFLFFHSFIYFFKSCLFKLWPAPREVGASLRCWSAGAELYSCCHLTWHRLWTDAWSSAKKRWTKNKPVFVFHLW